MLRFIRFILISLSLFLIFPSTVIAKNYGDYIVLLHGIARSSSNMSVIEKHFTKRGYQVINIDYKSTDYNLQILADNVQKKINKVATNKNKKIHFIGYSMGGLIIRALINKNRPQNLGRVVMLGTPNQGSEVADFLKNNILYKKIYGPAGQQLTTNQSKIKNILGTVNYELGIIAGDRTIDPISSIIIDGKDDGKVSIKNTKTQNMTDHIVIHTTHMFMMTNKNVIKQIEYFITNGNFKRNISHSYQ